jgi:hypothetical protein
MKQLIKAEPALDNSHDIQQQASVVEVLVDEQDQARVMKEELLQATVQLADLKAHITTKDSVIHAKDALLQSQELQLAQLKAEIRRLQLNHPPPPPSAEILVQFATRANSITSIVNHASFFSFKGDGRSGLAVVSDDGLSVSASLVPAAAAAAAVVVDDNHEVVNISDEDGNDDDAVAWVRCGQGLPAGCGVVRWAIQHGSSQVHPATDAVCDDEDSARQCKYNEHDFCVGVCGQGFKGPKALDKCKQLWALHQYETFVEDGEYDRKEGCRPLCIRRDSFHAGDALMFQLERTSHEEGVLRIGFSRKLNEENSLCDITIPAEGMLYPIVRLSKKMQTYTFVPLDRVRADAPPSRSPSPCHW